MHEPLLRGAGRSWAAAGAEAEEGGAGAATRAGPGGAGAYEDEDVAAERRAVQSGERTAGSQVMGGSHATNI